jgi:serine/threonine protein kinase
MDILDGLRDANHTNQRPSHNNADNGGAKGGATSMYSGGNSDDDEAIPETNNGATDSPDSPVPIHHPETAAIAADIPKASPGKVAPPELQQTPSAVTSPAPVQQKGPDGKEIPLDIKELMKGTAQFESDVGYALVGKEEDVEGTPSRFVKVKLLGSGAYGDAWLCKLRGGIVNSASDMVVAKTMYLPDMKNKELRYAQSEIQCLANTNHSNIVRFVDSQVSDKHLTILMEFADAGDLRKHIKTRLGMKHHLSESEAMLLFLQVVMALEHIHSRQMLHRDLKTANILISSSGLIKVADFGFSRQYEDTVSNTVAKTFCGTPYYLAPELWHGKRYSNRAEVWSLGIILYELFALDRPFNSSTIKGLMEQVCKNQTRALPDAYTDDARALVATLLSHDPSQRPNCIEIFKIPYVAEHFDTLVQLVAENPHISADTKSQWQAEAAALKTRLNTMPDWKMRSPPPRNSATHPIPDGFYAEKAKTTAVAPVASPNPPIPSPGEVRPDVRYQGAVNKLTTTPEQIWRQRYLYLQDGWLHLCENKGDFTRRRSLSIDVLQSVTKIPTNVAKRPFVLAVHTKDAKCTWLQAPDAREQHNWVDVIQKAMGVM